MRTASSSFGHNKGEREEDCEEGRYGEEGGQPGRQAAL